jgi:hypothetical protein
VTHDGDPSIRARPEGRVREGASILPQIDTTPARPRSADSETAQESATPLGLDDEREPAASTPPRPPSRGPALIVIGIVAFITVGGWLLATLGASPHVTTGDVASPPGLNLPAEHGGHDLGAIVVSEQPPSDIIGALVIPSGSTVTAHTAPSASIGLYDGSITLDVPTTAKRVVAFFTYELKHNHWQIADTVSGSNGGTNIYALHNSSDGYVWEVGVLVEGKSGAITPALAGGGAPSETSSVELRIIERDDED